MGQKVNPHGLRVGLLKDWNSRWLAEDYDMNYEDSKQKKNYHKSKVKEKIRMNSFNCSIVRQLVRAVMQKVTKRLILPRQNC
jgi:small subunit ribosomal protein S3